MSKPGIIYRIQQQSFHESIDVQTIVDISDYDNLIGDGDTPEIRRLVSSGSPINLSVIDLDEDPMTSIKALQATIRFNSDYNYSMTTFLFGSGRRWLVHAYIGTDDKTVFKGYLVKNGMQEAFMPVPNIVQLVATDQIGLLKNLPLIDLHARNPIGNYKLIDLIAMVMKQTGLSLEFRVAFNIKRGDLVDDISVPNVNDEHFFSTTYLEAKTFEDTVGKSENCYSALQKILGEEAFITQRQGMWWIIRVDEIEDPARGLYITSFDANGNFIANLGVKHFEKNIGRTETIKFINGATLVTADLPNKTVILNFDYLTPLEVPANIDFDRGALFDTISPTQKRYNLDGWSVRKGLGSVSTIPTCLAYIERIFDANAYEVKRYAVLSNPAVAASPLNYLESEPIPLGLKDKFRFSIDFAWEFNASGSSLVYTQSVATLRFEGDDGTFWTLDQDKIWYQTTSSFPLIKVLQVQHVPNNIDETEYRTLSIDAPPAPAAGNLFIQLYSLNQQVSGIDDMAIHFANLLFEYIPFINGSYQKYTAQSHSTKQSTGDALKREKQVFVSDSPKKLYKGSFLKVSSDLSLFSGSAEFANGSSIALANVSDYKYRPGMILVISGTASNNMTTRVVRSSYSIILSKTVIEIEDATVSETAAATLIETHVFSLASAFYNAAVFPGGPPSSDYIHPYGEIQLFDGWNQFKNTMRVFQAICQGCDLDTLDPDTLPNHIHLVHKWKITDITPHTIDKYFLLLNFVQNWRTGEWSGTLREVVNLGVAKDYSNHEFKYKAG